MSSYSPIDTGTFVVRNGVTTRFLDKLYIQSSKIILQDVNLSTNYSYTYCHIDKIDDKEVIGTLGETIPGNDQVIRRSNFKAAFH